MSLKVQCAITSYVLHSLILLAMLIVFINASDAELRDETIIPFQDLNNVSSINSTYLENTSDTVENNSTSKNGMYGYQKHPSKIAAVVVYGVAAFIGIFGVLIKYFVMQYERAQAKAQLEYQQLQTVKTY